LSYVLGIDLGTSYSAAAIDEDGRTEIVQLGSRAAVIPSVVVLRSDGEVLTGEAAERRSQSEPGRTAREFKRRLGDPTPLILGGTPYGAEAIASLLFKAVVDRVVEQRGQSPQLVAVTHPASYGPYKLDLLRQAVRQADIGETLFISEPEAAALHYAAQERVETGTIVAVYDFGGGTFDAAVLRKTENGFEQLGQPEGIERLGGIDFDEAIFQHVLAALRDGGHEVDANDGAVQTALLRVREECREAKEALSSDTEAIIPVALPGLHTDVRLTRSEFEAIVSPRVRETVAALQRSVRSAGLTVEQVDRVLLVGGSSRIPVVAALVRELTGRPVAIDSHPKHAVALGAAREARRRIGEQAPQVPAGMTATPAEEPVAAIAPPTEANPARPKPSPGGADGGGRKVAIGLGAVAALAAAAVGAFLLLGDSDEPPQAVDPTPTTANTRANTTATPTPPPTAAPTPTLAPNTSRITGIELAGNRYSVAFETGGFVPRDPGQHVHFFFSTVPPLEAGIPEDGPWFVYAGGSPFTGYGPADRPAAATQMCILVANANHSVNQGTGNCFDLPQ
jgi:actin-like ATPase involved in cell morphogenesis